MSLIQGAIRTFKANYTGYSMDKIINAMKEKPDRENIMKVWKDYTFEDANVVIEKAVRTIKPKTINYCWRKLCPDVVHDFIGAHQGNHERAYGYEGEKKVGNEVFQDLDLEEIQE